MKVYTLFVQSAIFAVTTAQQIYFKATGPTPRLHCSSTITAQPSFRFGNFTYSLSETVRTATPVASPTTTETYAPPFQQVSSLLKSATYTTWGSWDPKATTTATDTDNPFGKAAWTALWQRANPMNFTATGLYSTTVSPTPVPSSELVLPPRDYFGPSDCYNFPTGFKFGVAGSAAQIEGATSQEGKSPTFLDVISAPGVSRADVTNENYYLYKQDILRVAAMGVRHYSFSISWARILPFALPGTPINQQGIDHYNDLIEFVIEHGMIPEVTLIHFDTPLQFYGNLSAARERPPLGYVNGAYTNDTFVESFVNYAKIVMCHFGSRVPVFYTFNEPLLYAANGVGVYNVIQAHAKVYHFYKEELNGTGQISIKFNNNFGVPLDASNEADIYAANHFNSIQLGTFANPIFLGIDYPESFKQTLADHVPLTAEDLAYINGTADFFAIDPYTATVVAPLAADDVESILNCASSTSDPNLPYCVNQTTTNQFGWNIGYRSQSYVYITPVYLREYLGYLYNTWRKPVVITEFGFPVFGESDKDLPDRLFDTPRSLYYLSYMSEVLKAIWEDGVDVQGAFAWSFADNWEFGDDSSNFGLQVVNKTTQQRFYKKSFFDLVDFMRARGVV